MGTQGVRPAYYALERGGWRDYVTLLHPPYTLWHLSYVAIGAGLAPEFHLDRLLWSLAAFFLAMGLAAHALDEVRDRPLQTQIPERVLWALSAAALVGAIAIGVGAALAWGLGLLLFVAVGAFLVPAYNLELFGGRFHSDLWFALAWGAFPALTASFVQAQALPVEGILAAAFAAVASLAQRQLSTPVRLARRAGGTTAGTEPLEHALRALAWAMPLLAAAVVTARLT